MDDTSGDSDSEAEPGPSTSNKRILFGDDSSSDDSGPNDVIDTKYTSSEDEKETDEQLQVQASR